LENSNTVSFEMHTKCQLRPDGLQIQHTN